MHVTRSNGRLSRKKIGFDLSPLTDAATFGVSYYAIELLRALASADEFDLCLLYPWSLQAGQAALAELKAEHIQIPLRVVKTRCWEQLVMPALAARAGCDAIHCVANVAPVLGYPPVVLTLHDVTTYSGQAGVSAATMKYLNRFGPRGVRRTSAIITATEYSGQEIADFFAIDRARLSIVPHGVNEAFFQAQRQRDSAGHAPRVLACGSPATNKNVAVTLLAFAQILARFPEAQLMLFSMRAGTEALLLQTCADVGIAPLAVSFVSAPDHQSMARIYADSDLLLFPTLSEGFGLPVIEAFAAGVPVVTSSYGAVAEVSGDAAVLVDPADPAALAAAAIGILENADLRDHLRERGRRRAAGFTWKATAARTADVYRKVLGVQH